MRACSASLIAALAAFAGLATGKGDGVLLSAHAGDVPSSQRTVSATTHATVAITSPSEGDRVGGGSVLVTGVSANASRITAALADGTLLPVTGTKQWSALIDGSQASVGQQFVTITAHSEEGDAQASVSFTVGPSGSHPTGAVTQITYTSSVDGQNLGAKLYTPPAYDADAEGPVPLVIFLHGANLRGMLPNELVAELGQRRWIGVGPDGRRWNLAKDRCWWQYSVSYVDSDDPDIGPGQQDILDAITWAQENYSIDPRRIYLAGYSMGGRGAYTIGLKNPDMFAAIGVINPPTDVFDLYHRVERDRRCLAKLAGGPPGASPAIDTMYKTISARFYLENAFALPVHHAHGVDDELCFNKATAPDQYLHGWHMTVDESWDGCHGETSHCFGRTPTLQRLNARHPEGYDWAYLFGRSGHAIARQYIRGGAPAKDDVGTVDPNNPEDLIGMVEFFSRRQRRDAPETVVYKTYTESDRRAYWLTLDSAAPDQDTPAAVRAVRDPDTNAISAELARAKALTLDLDRAGISAGSRITLTLATLNEPVFDPAIAMTDGEVLSPTIVLESDFGAMDEVIVWRNGERLNADLVHVERDRLSLGPIRIEGETQLEIVPSRKRAAPTLGDD